MSYVMTFVRSKVGAVGTSVLEARVWREHFHACKQDVLSLFVLFMRCLVGQRRRNYTAPHHHLSLSQKKGTTYGWLSMSIMIIPFLNSCLIRVHPISNDGAEISHTGKTECW